MSLLCPICKRYNQPAWEHGPGKCEVVSQATDEVVSRASVVSQGSLTKQQRWKQRNRDKMRANHTAYMRQYRQR